MALPQGPFYAALGKRIREARKMKKVTQEQLAKAVGLSRTSVTNIETGRQPIYTHTVIRIAEILGAQIGEMLPPSMPQSSAVAEPQLQQLEPTKRDWVNRILGKQSHPLGGPHVKNHTGTKKSNRVLATGQNKKGTGPS
jgi:transcriptional regulator with XRE-family HTH domain